jgi:S-methylmethionine-dependent homocysteine/selenocysteine methylase
MALPMILDGGNGHLLRRLGVRIQGPIGSMERFLNVALANRDQPETVVRAHRTYLEAGSVREREPNLCPLRALNAKGGFVRIPSRQTVITTNNYSCVPAALELAPEAPDAGADFGPALLKDLVDKAGQLAVQARDEHYRATGIRAPRTLIAGSVPPLHESYRPDRVADEAEMQAGYSVIVPTIAPYSDVLLCETMSAVREGKAAVTAAGTAGLPIWVAWTMGVPPPRLEPDPLETRHRRPAFASLASQEDADGTLRSGEPIEEAVAAVAGLPFLEGMLVNCSSAESTEKALAILKKIAPPGITIGAYANGFNTVKGAMTADRTWELITR